MTCALWACVAHQNHPNFFFANATEASEGGSSVVVFSLRENGCQRTQNRDSSSKDGVEQALRDPAKKVHLLQRLGIGDSDENKGNTGRG